MDPALDTTVEIRLLGRTAYHATLALQRQLQGEVRAGQTPEVLLITEHQPVITLGRAHSAPDLRVPATEVTARGIEIVQTERGGDITYHGPGQLVAYAIIDLRARALGPADFVGVLEDSAIAVLRELGVEGWRDPAARGVWVAHRKLASVGINVRSGVSMHGMAMNIGAGVPDSDGFRLINPCGNPTIEMTSVERELGCAVSFDVAAGRFGQAFLHQLALQYTYPDTYPTGNRS